jgi:hypothetical protein
MLQDIVAVEPLENYQLRIHFEDGVEGIVQLSQVINFTGVFAPLKDPDYFATVKVNPDWGTIYWENGADLDPDVLYYLVTNQTPEIPTLPPLIQTPGFSKKPSVSPQPSTSGHSDTRFFQETECLNPRHPPQ